MSTDRSERTRMSKKDRKSLEGRMLRGVLWGMTDDDCKERFGKLRGTIIAELKIKGVMAKERQSATR
jgi:hypothetical protein